MKRKKNIHGTHEYKNKNNTTNLKRDKAISEDFPELTKAEAKDRYLPLPTFRQDHAKELSNTPSYLSGRR